MFGKKTLTDLKAVMFLCAIDRYEGKRRAAREMDVSVDTISKYIEDMEKECGAALLSTSSGGCSLTSRGQRFSGYAREIERVLQHVYALVAENDEVKGEVRLLWDHNVRANIMSGDLWNLLKKHRNITITSSTVNGSSEIKDNSYDIAMAYHLPVGNDWELMYSKNIESRFFASSSYLRKYGYPLDLQDMLENHRMVFKRDTANWVKSGKSLMDGAKHKVYLSDSSFMINDAIANGIGIGIMPASFVRRGLVCLDNIKCDVSSVVYVVAHRESRSLPRVRVVSEYIQEILKNS